MEQCGFEYDLPPERIAQRPVARGSSRLLAARCRGEQAEIEDSFVRQLGRYLKPGDLLVLNDSKVIPCRFFAPLEEREVELFLLTQKSSDTFEALARPLRVFGAGMQLELSKRLAAEVLSRSADGRRLVVRLRTKGTKADLQSVISEDALVPIPPYIRGGHSDGEDRASYQTVYAREPGSRAAPTAGLHFTRDLLTELRDRGVEQAFVTLHIGTASFLRADQQDPELRTADEELFTVSSSAREAIAATKAQGGRVVAVGTTVVRALESMALAPDGGALSPTRLLITPGFRFQVVDALFTNFHQPGSTHLLLVSAFVGERAAAAIYEHALAGPYRFLSYGDAMLLLPEAG